MSAVYIISKNGKRLMPTVRYDKRQKLRYIEYRKPLLISYL